MHKTLLLFNFLLWCSILALGQEKSPRLQGKVKDAQTGRPLADVNLYFKQTGLGTATDSQGQYRFFTLPSVPDTLVVKIIGYERKVVYLDQAKLKSPVMNFILQPQAIELGEVVKVAERITLPEPTVYRIRRREIQKVPALAESDVIRAIQGLPGVATTDDFNSKPYLRGGDTHHSGLLFDGIPMYNAYHFAGLFSVFHPELLDQVEVKPGGYPVNYGNYLSGLILTTSRPGSVKNYGGALNMSLLSTQAIIEGPLPGQNNSFIWSARRSHLEVVSLPTGDPLFPYYFMDTQARMDILPSKADKITFSSVGSSDRINGGGGDEGIINWSNVVLGLHWQHLFSAFLHSRTTLGLSRNTFFHGQEPEPPPEDFIPSFYSSSYLHSTTAHEQIRNNIRHLLWRQELTYLGFLDQMWILGVESNWYRLSYRWSYLNGKTDAFKERGVNLFFDYEPPFYRYYQTFGLYSVYLQHLWGLTRPFSLALGGRVSKIDKQPNIYFEPRIHLQYQLTPRIRLKGAAGVYYQHLTTAKEEGGFNFEFTGLFYFYDVWFPIREPLTSSRALQTLVGMELNLPQNATLSIQTYFNRLYHLLAVEPDRDQPIQKSVSEDGYPIFSQGEGFAEGVEILLERKAGRVSGALSYTLSRIVKKFGQQIYYGKQDQRHAVKLFGTIALGKGWEFSLSGTWHSGLPYTPAVGKYSSTPYRGWELIMGARNSARLPDYYRFDFQISRKTKMLDRPALVYFNLQNLTNQKNVLAHFHEDRGMSSYSDTTRPKFQLPIIPTLGFTIYFGERTER